MKTTKELLNQAYDLGYQASKYIHILKGVLIGFIIAIGIFNYY